MGSVVGFRCRRCRAELVTPAAPAHPADRTGIFPAVLCCGQPVRPVETGQVLSVILPTRRLARCPACGVQVRIIVRPAGPLRCHSCGREMIVREHVSEQEDRIHPPPAAPTAGGDPPA